MRDLCVNVNSGTLRVSHTPRFLYFIYIIVSTLVILIVFL